MIQAHLATFPPRQALMEDVVARLAPQVDRLIVVLNEYKTVPRSLSAYDNVVPVIPPRDLKDAGKFMPPVEPNHIIFLVDDDIAYPADYVAKSLAAAESCKWMRDIFGYQGNAWLQDAVRWRVESYMFRRPLAEMTGVGLLGTGTVMMLGRHLPRLDQMESAKGFVDVRFARLMFERGLRLWALPRGDKWLRPTLPAELKAQSLYQTVHKAQPDLYVPELRSFVTRWDHMGQTYPAQD